MIHLLKVYVDDENVACEALAPGSRLIDGRVTVIESDIEIAQDLLIPEDIRTSRILLEIANSIYSWIQLTSDCPSQYPSKFMPILDIQCCMTDNQIRFKFFKKPVSNPLQELCDAIPDQEGRPVIRGSQVAPDSGTPRRSCPGR